MTMLFRTLRSDDATSVAPLLQAADLRMADIAADRYASNSSATLKQSLSGAESKTTDSNYVFVAEDTDAKRITGLIALRPVAGLLQPLYTFQLGKRAHASYDGNSYEMKDTLTLSNDLVESAVLGIPILTPGAPEGTAQLLCGGALMFVTGFAHLFPSLIVTRLRGVRRQDSSSPFWDGLGRHFVRKNHLSVIDSAGVPMQDYGIAELMPKWPIYLDLLPKDLQDSLGKQDTLHVPWRNILERHGFASIGHFDVVDGGAYLGSRCRDLQLARSVNQGIAIGQGPCADRESGVFIHCNARAGNFRAIVEVEGNGGALHEIEIAAALGSQSNDELRTARI